MFKSTEQVFIALLSFSESLAQVANVRGRNAYL